MESRSAIAEVEPLLLGRLTSHRPSAVSRIASAGDRATVWVVGPVDRATITQVGGWLRGLMGGGVRHVTVNVSAATGCNGRLLALLAHTHERLGTELVSFTVVGVQLPEFLTALRAATLDEVFIIYDVVRRESRRAPGRHRRAMARPDDASIMAAPPVRARTVTAP